MFGKLKAKLIKKKSIVNQDGSSWHLMSSAGCGGVCNHNDGAYDNIFPDVSRIAEQIATILPYAIDINGERLDPQPQVVKALYSPNKEMSGPEFFETIATLVLVHPSVYILVHRMDGKRGEITPENIGGFTFLEHVTPRFYNDGSASYDLDGIRFTDKEVISISLNVNPYSVIKGYSPAVAAKKWANLDDYIVDWQSGNFLNNAIPAGQFVITARSVDEFNDIVDEMERRHKGAGRNNNVSYVHRPTSSIDGKPLPAQIEWVPFAQSPKDLALDSVFNQANKKTAMAFGVPEEIKGFVQNSNYASVSTAERIFDKYTVLPKATKIWAKFTHELNRITGGLGYALSFDYEMAQLADEDKINAETTKIQLETLRSALEAGFDLESSVIALGLPDGFKELQNANPTEETNSEVVEDFEPEASQIEQSAKTVKKKSVATDGELEMLLSNYTEEQIESAINGKEFDLEKESKKEAKLLLPVIMAGALLYAMGKEGEVKVEASAKGYDVSNVTDYLPSDLFKDTYLKYLEEVMLSYSEDTNDAIKRTMEMAYSEGMDQEGVNTTLRGLLPSEFWRIRRLQRTESHRSSQMASLDMARQVEREANIDGMTKVWHLNPASLNHCELCEQLDGTELPLGDSFEEFADANELGKFSAGAGDVADAHPNCECYLTYNIPNNPVDIEIDSSASFKALKCPKCKRYICDCEKSARLNNVVCSRCGTHFDKEAE